MLRSPKIMSPGKFWILTTIYIIISSAAAFTSSSASINTILGFMIGIAPFYALFWLLVTIICSISKQIRYDLTLTYPILFTQTILILLHLGLGYYYSDPFGIITGFYCSILIVHVMTLAVFTIDLYRGN